MWVISYLGPSGAMGGIDKLDFFTGMWVIAAFSLVILALAVRTGQSRKAALACADSIKDLGSRGMEIPKH
jgi:hypothetical protein